MNSTLKLFYVTLLLFAMPGCVETNNATRTIDSSLTSATFNPSGAPTVEFVLPSMVCNDPECALAVKDILARQPGTAEVLVDVAAKTATVAVDEGKFDSQIAIAELRDRGFDLELATAAEFNPTGAPTIDFAVPDMMCEEGCAFTVKDILSKQQGTKDVRVDFAAKTATVAIDQGKFDPQMAVAELVDKGFGNSALKSQPSATSTAPIESPEASRASTAPTESAPK